MNCKIPFTKDIDLERKIFEITSISLEHEIKIEENTLKGNFIVTGDFKSHEVSVNKEAFSYVLPFEIDLLENIDADSVEFMIDDFTYEVVDSSILRVNIDFNVVGNILEVQEEEAKEEIFRDATELFKEQEEEVLDSQTEEVEIEKEEMIEEEKGEEQEDVRLEENQGIEKKVEDTIINSISGAEEEYATYHIHMVSDGESVETICTMYNSNVNILSEYNDLTSLTEGDKLIIPDKNE